MPWKRRSPNIGTEPSSRWTTAIRDVPNTNIYPAPEFLLSLSVRQRSRILAECLGARKQRIEGNPNPSKISTSYAERNNGIIRQHCKRYARLTLAFPKKLENHVYAFALHTMYHNFVKISGAHRMTPAQAAG